MIEPDNTASIRVAERLGMTPRRTDTIFGTPVVVRSVSRRDWRRVVRSARGHGG